VANGAEGIKPLFSKSSLWYHKGKNRQKALAGQKRYEKRLFKKRICRSCMGPLPKDHKTRRCPDCVEKGRIRQKNLRVEKALYGECLDCSEDAVPGKSRCQKHLDKNAQLTWDRFMKKLPKLNQYTGWRYL
jgi:hypothetical protein